MNVLVEIDAIPDQKGREGHLKLISNGGEIVPFFDNIDTLVLVFSIGSSRRSDEQ